MADQVTLVQSAAMTAVDFSDVFTAGEAALDTYAWKQLGASTSVSTTTSANSGTGDTVAVTDVTAVVVGGYIQIGTNAPVRVEMTNPFSNTIGIREPQVWASGAVVVTRSVDAVSPPAGTALNTSTGIWNGTPTTLGTSAEQFVRVVDLGGLTQDSNIFDVVVQAAGTTPPVFSGPINNQTYTVNSGGGSFTFNVSGFASGTVDQYLLSPTPAGFSINATSGVITGPTTAFGVFGPFTVTYRNLVNGDTLSNPFTLTVTSDTPPNVVVGRIQDLFTPRNVVISTIDVSSAFSSAQSFSSTANLPPGVTLDNLTGRISGTPTVSGFYPGIVISGTNTQQGTISLPAFDWNVYETGAGYFPVDISGMTFEGGRDPVWNTGYQESPSGKATAIAYRQYPIYEWTVNFELLRHDVDVSELKRLYGLFNAMRGRVGTFLYLDKLFCAVEQEVFGAGDGTTKTFQMVATFKNVGGDGAPEIIQNLNGAPKLFDNGGLLDPTAYSISPTGMVTFGTAPVNGHSLTWTGGFYYRCRFTKDTQSFSEFMSLWWASKGIKFRSVIL